MFYLDRGGGLEMVRWWLHTWRFLGLDTAAQAMDLVLLTHPAAVAELPAECGLVEEGFRLNYSLAGRCLYKPYLGVAHRDKSYDPYMNSQECLFGPGSEFLGQYSHLLRYSTVQYSTVQYSTATCSGRTSTPSPARGKHWPLDTGTVQTVVPGCWAPGPRVCWWTATT